MSKHMRVRAVIYVRISDDKRGEGAGVERQRADAERLAKRLGFEVVEVFDDNDRSATKGTRPAYQRMVERVASGDVQVVIAYSQERLWRDELEHPLFMRMAREVGARVHLVNGGEVDPSDANDALVSTIMNAVAVMEAATTRRRVNRELVERRKAGKYLGGGRAFGHNADRTEIEPTEAVAIVDAVKRVAEGESVTTIVNEWRAAGLLTVTGKQWSVSTLVQLLRQPRLAGLVEVEGNKYTRKADGIEGTTLVPAAWPRIVDVDVWREAVRVLKVRNHKRGRPAQQHALSGGLLRCGKCGTTMHAGVTGGQVRRTLYRCPSSSNHNGGCGGVTIDATRTENHLRDKVLTVLDSKEFAAAIKRAIKAEGSREFREAHALLARKRARLTDVETMFREDELEPREYKRLRDPLRDDIARLERQVNEAQGATVVPVHLVGTGAALAVAWEHMTVAERRDVFTLVLDRVVIDGTTRGKRWNADRVHPEVRWLD